MIIAYHEIFTTYGAWLPNDPRGSFSKGIYNSELRALGKIRYGRQNPQPHRTHLIRFWTAAMPHLGRPPFFIDDKSRAIIAVSFGKVVHRLALQIPACAIMNDHVHFVALRSKYKIEYTVNQLKGAATSALKLKNTPWSRSFWKVFIDNDEALAAAVDYVRSNPAAAGLASQSWDFVTPLCV